MKYNQIVRGTFIQRINRFIAEVEINQQVEVVHVKNTGRCKELFIMGAIVFLEKSKNPERKTAYSLIGIFKDHLLINIDSQVPNQVVYEALMSNKIQEIGLPTYAKREVTYNSSRFDIYYETKTTKGFIEVKGVTLERGGLAMFPDAPTARGRKHLLELIAGQKEGYTNYIFFLIQMENITRFSTNQVTDLPFALTLQKAKEKGVQLLIYNSLVTDDSIQLNQKCEFITS